MAQVDEDKGTTKKKPAPKPVSVSDKTRGSTPAPKATAPAPKATAPKAPAAKAPTVPKPNPSMPGLTTPQPSGDNGGGGGGDSGGGARGGGGGKMQNPAPPAQPYNPLQTLAQNWRVGSNIKRIVRAPVVSAPPPTPIATRRPAPIATPVPRVILGERPMTGSGNQPARLVDWGTLTTPTTRPPNLSDLGRAGAGMAGGGNPMPIAAPAISPIARAAAQGAAAGGIGAVANTPLFAAPGGSGGVGGGGGYGGVPAGVDPVWYNQFMAEHNGQTPEEVYKYSDNPLGQALWDKAWGDQFLAGNYRAPGEEDWRNTYGSRYRNYSAGNTIFGNASGYGGGGYGGGGGGGEVAPGEVAPAAASTIPQLYQAGFNLAFGAPASTYYTPERGGEQQMTKDYYALHDMWQNALGRPVDPTEWERIWRDLLSYKAGRGNQAAPLTMADIYGYTNRMTRRAPQPPELSYLKIAEL